MNNRSEKQRRHRLPGLGTRGGSIIEYIMIAGIVSLAAIHGFKQAQMRETRVIAQQARLVRTLDPTNPSGADFGDPDFGSDDSAPFCNLQGVCSGPGQCFAKGTLVATEKGLVAIEKLNDGDLVWSRDEGSGDLALRPVLHRYVTHGQAIMDLNLAAGNEHETIRATTGHPFWTPDHGWVSAGRLANNEELFSAAGDSVHVAPMTNTALAYETVYNLEIAEFHTYFVGHHGVWVHNATKPPAGTGPNPPACQQPGYVPPNQTPGTIGFASNTGLPLGGSFREIEAFRDKDNKVKRERGEKGNRIGGQIHHMPSDDVWNKWPGTPPFDHNSGPAIWMETADHALTGSNGQQSGSDKWRKKELEMVQAGNMCGAIAMDILNVRSKVSPPTKYDVGIQKMLDYVNSQIDPNTGKTYNCSDPGLPPAGP